MLAGWWRNRMCRPHWLPDTTNLGRKFAVVCFLTIPVRCVLTDVRDVTHCAVRPPHECAWHAITHGMIKTTPTSRKRFDIARNEPAFNAIVQDVRLRLRRPSPPRALTHATDAARMPTEAISRIRENTWVTLTMPVLKPARMLFFQFARERLWKHRFPNMNLSESEMTQLRAAIVCLALSTCTFVVDTHAESPAIKDDASLTQIVDTLVTRHGGSTAADRWKCGTIQFTTSAGIFPATLGSVTVTESFEFPGSFKRSFVAESPEGEIDFTFTINEQGGWMTSPGKPTMEISRSFADRERHTFADIANVAHLRANVSQLSIVDRFDVDGKPAVHLRLESEELGRGEFFVDLRSGLLVKTSKQTQDLLTGVDATIETRLGKYEEIDGIPVPMTFSATSDGKKILEVEITSVEFKDSLPASIFAKPK